MPAVTLRLTPRGQLLVVPVVEPAVDSVAETQLPSEFVEQVEAAFAISSGAGLWYLGSRVVGGAVTQPWTWWRDFAALFVTAVCRAGDAAVELAIEPPPADERQRWCWSLPPMVGAEYMDDALLLRLWQDLDAVFKAEVRQHPLGTVDALLQECHPSWHAVGRVYVHLAENRKDEQCPFAFLVTYTVSLGQRGTAKHVPLAQALQEFATDRERLIALLEPLIRASVACPWLKKLIDNKAIYHPLRWSASEALQFLRDAQAVRDAGVVVRLPAAWRSNRPTRVQVSGTIGSKKPSAVGVAALLDFKSTFAVDGDPLDSAEIAALLAGSDGLQLIRGRWVEVDRARLQRTLAHFSEIEALSKKGGLGFHEAMRLLAGGDNSAGGVASDGDTDWSAVQAGDWLAQTLSEMRQPSAAVTVPADLQANLRPYQLEGLRWLSLLAQLRLGACLADDMGLGKTMQILALLLLRCKEKNAGVNLLVAPASLLTNWAAEAARFAPTLRVRIIHSSVMDKDEFDNLDVSALSSWDLVIISYGSVHRWSWLTKIPWRLVILDEAQAIKNGGSRQTRAVKLLPAQSRIILTGTPVENHLGDLWSLFDFVNPGLLGTSKVFSAWTKRLRDHPNGYAPLRRLVQPYLLRRLKSDKSVISDLPDKVEQTVWCSLARKQGALYEQAVRDLERDLAQAEGIKRRGLVLAYVLRFKQICNHPSQWLGDGDWDAAHSGKFAQLDELCETIAERQEKVLVFTQFRETTTHLAAHLAKRFGHPGLVLTGSTSIPQRRDMVQQFQNNDQIPFFVISLKAGGSGLNLSAANHVIHFDRWWNPAVENQATDRAYRIGQHRNVMVHKFTCRGTIEERVAAMMVEKQALADEMFDGQGNIALTELSDADLLHLVRLDVHAVSKD